MKHILTLLIASNAIVIPPSLIGRTFLQNGPLASKSESPIFFNQGEITSVYFANETHTVTSCENVPGKSFFKIQTTANQICNKMMSLFLVALTTKKMNTCNTAFSQINDKIYATEETSNPFEISIGENGKLNMIGFVHNFPGFVIAAHQPYHNEYFAYKPHENKPLAILGKKLNWSPSIKPAMIHDSRKISEDLYIFPLSTLQMGNIFSWLLNNKTFPMKNTGTLKWLIYNQTDDTSRCIDTGIFDANIFHIAHTTYNNNVINIWTSISSSMKIEQWIDSEELENENYFCKFQIDLLQDTCLHQVYNDIRIEFPSLDHTQDSIIGLKNHNVVIKVNMSSLETQEFHFKNKISEICVVDDGNYVFLETNLESKQSFVVIADNEFEEICRVNVPFREHTFHSHLI